MMTAGRLRRHPLSYSKVRSALGPILRAWPIRRSPRPGDYLNIGCGPFSLPEFFNIDYDFHSGVDLYHDLRNALPIADQVAAGVFSEHCLEHLSFADGERAVLEFFRVLQPGRTLRVSAPDGGAYARRYLAGEAQPYAPQDAQAEGFTDVIDYTGIMSLNRLFYGSGHRFIYDAETLIALLRRCGFSDVRQVGFRQGRDPKLLIDQAARAPETLYVEGVRP